ncbi:LytR/AlgR family response regulator transcription factor [Leptospira sarikeiensis]|uniref:DNA-binding response regulator n=1 Tax=Leptospira sarikeiensis TaxID=2484943 RepID=A0A4R9K5C2_9LEPT|nr:LytTR family DNA-binding domain-containing protein [Leptospira sarikeiensis]TGL60477.1 DNA-binding response regulator [Leptospira sarikeiensis]
MDPVGKKPPLSVFIAEDEYPARELLVRYIMARPELRLAGMAEDGDQAFQIIQESNFDILFMDIDLPGRSGIQVLESLNRPTYVIFTTADSKFAVQAFDLGAVDYLLKPFTSERFDLAVDRALKFKHSENTEKTNVSENTEQFLSFSENSVRYRIEYKDILYFTSNNKRTIIHTFRKDYETSKLLKDILETLPVQKFLRIHKQHVVNLQFVSHIHYTAGGAYLVYLKDEEETPLPVGRTFASELRKRLGL